MGPLLNFFRFPSLVDDTITLNEVVSRDGNWNWDYLRCFLDNDIIYYITIIPTSNFLVGQDVLISIWSPNGVYTVQSAYNMILENYLNPLNNKWKLIWTLGCL